MSKLAVRILTNGPSDGVKNLSDKLEELGVDTVRLRNDQPAKRRLIPKPTIKWGCFSPSKEALVAATCVLNSGATTTVLNKLQCLDQLKKHQVPTVDFTADRAKAREWLTSGERLYVRRLTSSSGGEGIEVLENASAEIPTAPLYTKGVKGKRREYRIHVFTHNGIRRFWVQQKLRRQGFKENEKYESTIRNLDHGWVFAHNEITPPKEHTIGAAVAACEAFGLTFGAVDLIETDKGGAPYVLEINTAPGLEGGTVEFYANCIKDSLSVKN